MIEVSIQIVNYNTCERLRKTLNAIVDSCNDVEFEIIVVDNNSVDNSVEMVHSEYPNVHLVANDKNRFFGPGHNQASKIANGKYLLILNSDVTISERALRRMVDFMEQNSEVGCCSPLLENEYGAQTSYWNERNVWQYFRNKAPLSLFFKQAKDNRNPETTVYQLGNELASYPDVLCGACMLIHNDLFNKIGAFDEQLLMYFTDDDLCIRVRESGYKIAALHSIKAYHEEGHSSKKSKKLKIVNIERVDRNRYFFKHSHPFHALVSVVFGWLEILIVSLNPSR